LLVMNSWNDASPARLNRKAPLRRARPRVIYTRLLKRRRDAKSRSRWVNWLFPGQIRLGPSQALLSPAALGSFHLVAIMKMFTLLALLLT